MALAFYFGHERRPMPFSMNLNEGVLEVARWAGSGASWKPCFLRLEESRLLVFDGLDSVAVKQEIHLLSSTGRFVTLADGTRELVVEPLVNVTSVTQANSYYGFELGCTTSNWLFRAQQQNVADAWQKRLHAAQVRESPCITGQRGRYQVKYSNPPKGQGSFGWYVACLWVVFPAQAVGSVCTNTSCSFFRVCANTHMNVAATARPPTHGTARWC